MVVQTLRDITKESASPDSGMPSGRVHAKLLEMREIDDDSAVLATDAKVGIAMATTAWLDFESLVRGALHDCSDLIGTAGARYCRGGDAEGRIVRLYGGELVESVRGQ